MGRMDIDVEEEAAAFGAIKTALAEGEDAADASKTVRGKGDDDGAGSGAAGGDAPATSPGKSDDSTETPPAEKKEGEDDGAAAADAAKKAAEGSGDAGKVEGDEGAGKKEGEEDKAPVTPAAKPDYAVRTPVVRGTKRSFDLSDPDQAKQYDAFAQKGMNYDLLVEEFDEKVKGRAQEGLGNWFYEQGILAEGADGKPAFSVEGAVGWLKKAATEAFGPAGLKALQESVGKALTAAEDEDSLSVDEINAELKTLDPDLDAPRIADLKKMRAMAKRLAAIPNQIKEARAPLDERLAAADKAQAQEQVRATVAALDKHLDAELAKYPGFSTSRTYSEPSDPADPKSVPKGRVRIVQRAMQISAAATGAGVTKTRDQCLSEAAKYEYESWAADIKAAREASMKEADRLRKDRPAPGKTAPSPGSKGGAGVPSPAAKLKPGTPEWEKATAERLGNIRAGLKG